MQKGREGPSIPASKIMIKFHSNKFQYWPTCLPFLTKICSPKIRRRSTMKWSTYFLTTENRDPIYLITAAVVFILGKFVALRAQCGTPDFMWRGGPKVFSDKKILASIFSRDFIWYWKLWKKSRWKKDCCLTYCLGIRVCNTRVHVVIVILSLLDKAPKFSMGFLRVSFTYWIRRFFGVSLQARSILL